VCIVVHAQVVENHVFADGWDTIQDELETLELLVGLPSMLQAYGSCYQDDKGFIITE